MSKRAQRLHVCVNVCARARIYILTYVLPVPIRRLGDDQRKTAELSFQ